MDNSRIDAGVFLVNSYPPSNSKLLFRMSEFLQYVRALETMALSGHPTPAVRFASALDGEAGQELRRLVRLDVRRNFGAFFTGSELAGRLIELAPPGGRFYDPSCGAGDLLLAATRQLQVKATLRETIAYWSRNVAGCDLNPEFVRAAKARLVLMARSRGLFTETLSAGYLQMIFPGIVTGDALCPATLPLRRATILANPPYFLALPPLSCRWCGVGKVNAAAVFVSDFLRKAAPGATLLAILPEVLRSGSKYKAWRNEMAAACGELTVQSWGLFDANADVDVFLLKLRKRTPQDTRGRAWPAARNKAYPLSSRFEVSVGAVVPHRHDQIGVLRRYLDARSAPTGGVVRKVKVRRKFMGTVVQPPFVTVKRTSRPGDKFRAAATVVTGSKPVAVENHLIVCRPIDGTLAACEGLARRLHTAAVNRALNRAIRCRHLTVGAIKQINLGA